MSPMQGEQLLRRDSPSVRAGCANSVGRPGRLLSLLRTDNLSCTIDAFGGLVRDSGSCLQTK